MQAGTTFKLEVRTALPLTETLAAQKATLPRPYSRVVFIFDYADSPLLHSIEEAVRRQNVYCLGLHKTPASIASRNRAASVYGGASKAPGQMLPVIASNFACHLYLCPRQLVDQSVWVNPQTTHRFFGYRCRNLIGMTVCIMRQVLIRIQMASQRLQQICRSGTCGQHNPCLIHQYDTSYNHSCNSASACYARLRASTVLVHQVVALSKLQVVAFQAQPAASRCWP